MYHFKQKKRHCVTQDQDNNYYVSINDNLAELNETLLLLGEDTFIMLVISSSIESEYS